MTADQLRTRLGIDAATLADWQRRGLPREKRGRAWHYDPAAVERWLIDTGRATRPRVVTTQDELAQALGVAPRTIGYWKAAGMPGQPGAYDLDRIETWRKTQTPAGDDARKQALATLAAIRAEREALRLAAERGDLIDLHAVTELLTAHTTEARAILQELPPAIAAALPEEIPTATRKAAREAADAAVRKTLETLAEAAARVATIGKTAP